MFHSTTVVFSGNKEFFILVLHKCLKVILLVVLPIIVDRFSSDSRVPSSQSTQTTVTITGHMIGVGIFSSTRVDLQCGFICCGVNILNYLTVMMASKQPAINENIIHYIVLCLWERFWLVNALTVANHQPVPNERRRMDNRGLMWL